MRRRQTGDRGATALDVIAGIIDRINEGIGRAVSWLALFMVLVQFIVVLMRYVFGIPSIFMQESIIYMHALIFMVGVGYTLLHNGHVRVDIFYSTASEKRKALIDLIGVAVFLVPISALIWWVSWPYVAMSWSVREGSVEVSGIQAIFLLKAVLLVFAVLLTIQGIAMALRSILLIAGGSSRVAADEEAGHLI